MTGPNAPTWPRSPKTARPRPTPPKPVDLARWLFILSAAVGMVRFVVQLSDRQTLIGLLRQEQQLNLSQDELDAAANGGILFGLLLAGGLLLVCALLANRMAAGHNWARVVLTVLAAAGIFFGLLRLITAGSGLASAFGLVISPVDLVLNTITMAIDAAAVVLAYRSPAGAYFRSRPFAVDRAPGHP